MEMVRKFVEILFSLSHTIQQPYSESYPRAARETRCKLLETFEDVTTRTMDHFLPQGTVPPYWASQCVPGPYLAPSAGGQGGRGLGEPGRCSGGGGRVRTS